jgi:hypothetical protein
MLTAIQLPGRHLSSPNAGRQQGQKGLDGPGRLVAVIVGEVRGLYKQICDHKDEADSRALAEARRGAALRSLPNNWRKS